MIRLLRRKRAKSRQRESQVRSPSHLRWVRGFECAVPECPYKGIPVEAAHVRSGTDGAMGVKPSDHWAIPLCRIHHATQHNMGESAFERTFGLDLKDIAKRLAGMSPHLRKS